MSGHGPDGRYVHVHVELKLGLRAIGDSIGDGCIVFLQKRVGGAGGRGFRVLEALESW